MQILRYSTFDIQDTPKSIFFTVNLKIYLWNPEENVKNEKKVIKITENGIRIVSNSQEQSPKLISVKV